MKLLFEQWRKFLIKEEMTQDGAAIVFLFNENDELLLLKRNKEADWMPEKWAVPGGGIESGESPEKAGQREVSEEIKISFEKVVHVKDVDEAKGKVHHLATKKFSGEPKLNFEHTDQAWVKIEELDEYETVPKLKKDAQDALAALKKTSYYDVKDTE